MSFLLKRSQMLPEALHTLAADRLDAALAALGGDTAEAVHEVRKKLKQLRALLRLARPALGEACFQRENAALRDLARPLAGVRDAQALLEAVGKLEAGFEHELQPRALARLRGALRARHHDLYRAVLQRGHALARAERGLRSARSRSRRWPLADADWGALRAGLERTYRQGLDAFAASQQAGEDLDLHEWRKQTKYLRHQLEVLSPLWPELLIPLEGQAHQLTNLLGDDHDLAVLLELLGGELGEEAGREDRELARALALRLRHRLQREAFALGERLYAERPGRFTGRVDHYWQAW